MRPLFVRRTKTFSISANKAEIVGTVQIMRRSGNDGIFGLSGRILFPRSE